LVFTPAVSLEINFECHIYHVTLNNIKDVIGKKCVLPMHNYIVNIFINADVSYDNHLCCRRKYDLLQLMIHIVLKYTSNLKLSICIQIL